MSGRESQPDTGANDRKLQGLTELHRRSADGIDVSLLWRRTTNDLIVEVQDERTGEVFELPAPAEKALDVFEHPYAYAAYLGEVAVAATG